MQDFCHIFNSYFKERKNNQKWQKKFLAFFLYFSNFFKKKNDPLCNVHCSWAYLEPKKERNSLAWIWDSCRKKNQIDRRRNEEIHTNTQKKYSSLGCVLLLRRRVVALCSKIQGKSWNSLQNMSKRLWTKTLQVGA